MRNSHCAWERIKSPLHQVSAQVIKAEELADGLDRDVFRNLNTPADWQEAKLSFRPVNEIGPFHRSHPEGVREKMGGECYEDLLLDASAELDDRQLSMATNDNPGPYIEFKDVSKSFGDNKVLDHVSFDVMAGETVCILGRSGVGKSVTLQTSWDFLSRIPGA